MKKVKCDVRRCGWQGADDDVLTGKNPFDYDDEIIGCPKCKSIDSIIPVCDEDGCWERASCGTPTKARYRNTCWLHKPDAWL